MHEAVEVTARRHTARMNRRLSSDLATSALIALLAWIDLFCRKKGAPRPSWIPGNRV